MPRLSFLCSVRLDSPACYCTLPDGHAGNHSFHLSGERADQAITALLAELEQARFEASEARKEAEGLENDIQGKIR